MLFALGFVSLFVTGGLTGPILAQPILDQYLHQTYFVVAHFHLIMAMAGIFGLFCATYYWFPLMTGRHMDERLGRWHFWLSIVGAYATFLPMHIAGLMGAPRHYAQWTGLPAASTALLARSIPMQVHITYAAFFLISAQFLFLWNVYRSWRHGTPAGEKPMGRHHSRVDACRRARTVGKSRCIRSKNSGLSRALRIFRTHCGENRNSAMVYSGVSGVSSPYRSTRPL